MMYKKLLTLGISFSTLLTPMLAIAQSRITEDTKRGNLTQTEQRLEDLIKAAAAQNLLEVSRTELGTPAAQLPTLPPQASNQTNSCSTDDLFSFSQETHAKHYEDILALKKDMITGPDQVDKHKAQILAQSYLGLGFGDEAINIAEHLQAPEQAVITTMAQLMRGTMNGTHIKTLEVNAACYDAAQIWQKLTQPDYENFTDSDLDYLNKLPEQLGKILRLRLALKAIQNKDHDTAQLIFADIQSKAENRESYDPAISPYMQNDAVALLDALLALKKDDKYEQGRGVSLLKFISKRDGPYRADALQALVETGHLYPDYMQDLESITQTFPETPSAKQAQAQKINFLAAQYQFANAVTVTKDSFAPNSGYYAQSVIIISREILSALRNSEVNLQLAALNTLIAEGDFFAHLTDADPLLYAGVKACINLGMPELAPKVLPIQFWSELDDTTLILLTTQDIRPEKFRIPLRIFETPTFKASELRKSLNNKNPKQALKIANAHPNSASLQNSFTQAAWDNGYWSLAQNGLRKNANEQVSNNLKLATTLSVLSPMLINTHLPNGLDDQQALQSYLDGDLKIIRSYLLPNTETTSGAKNG